MVAVAGVVIGLVATAFVGAAAPASAVDALVVHQVNAFSAFDSTVYKSVRATCEPGWQVIGTGYQLLGADGAVVLDDLIPEAHSVLVGAGEVVGPGEPADGTTESWQIEATAMCVPNTSMTLQIVSQPSRFEVAPFHDVVASCAAGTRALGMGASLANGFGQVSIDVLKAFGQFPSDLQPNRPRIPNLAVLAEANTDPDGYSGAWSITAYAICGPALPGLDQLSSTSRRDSFSKSTSLACPPGQTATSTGFQTFSQILVTTSEMGQQAVFSNGSTATAAERNPGTNDTWPVDVTPTCVDGTTTPIVTPFSLAGTWDAGTGTLRPFILEAGGLIFVSMSAYGRPNARGGVTDNTHITVSFPDDQTYTGTLVAPNRILWSNGTSWTKI